MHDFCLLMQRGLETVRQVNRSEILGRPLQWGTEWGQTIPEMLRGWSSGLLLIAGQSNHGKSSLAVTLALQFLQNNPELWVLDFTMDDDLRDRLSKYVAIASGLSPDKVKMEYEMLKTLDPSVLPIYEKYLQIGYDAVSSIGRLVVLDSQCMYSILHPEDNGIGLIPPTIDNIKRITMLLHHELAKSGGQILILIDAINDLLVEDRNASDNERLTRIGSELMTLAQVGNIRIVATAHARKVTNWRKPSMDDVYGASALKYAAKVITFVYNDYKVRRGESSLTMQMVPPDSDLRKLFPTPRTAPVLIWNFLKNKTSGLDGETFLMLDPFTTGVFPIEETDWDYYRSLLYQ